MPAQLPDPRYPLVRYLQTEKAYVAEINRILNRAASELSKEIAALGTKGNPITRAQMEASRAAIKQHLAQDWSDIGQVTAAGQKAAAEEASRVISKYEDVLLQNVMTAEDMRNLADAEAYRAAQTVNTTVARLQSSHRPLSSQVYDTKALTNGWVDDIVSVGLAKGQSAAQLAAAVKKFISPNTPGGASYAARRLARTEINNAYHAASVDRYDKSKIVDEVDWHLSSSHPEGDICDSYATDSPYDIKNVPEKPHPQCFCFLTPHLPTREEFINSLLAGKYGDEPWAEEASEFSKFDVDEQASERQRKLLEKARFDRKGNFNKERGWTADSYRSWTAYTEMGHKDMNALLRDPTAFAKSTDAYWVELASKQVDDLQTLLEKNALTDDIVVARGISVVSGFNPGTMKAGDLFADPAFLSTTTNMKEAADFASGRGAGTDGWTFITKAPKGTNAVAGADYQNEIIFKPGQMQRVLGVDLDGRTIYTEMIS